MGNHKNVISFSFIIFIASIISFNSVFAGKTWINYTDLKNVTCLAMNKQIQYSYCGTTGGLFIVDLNSNTIIGKYTNVEGLINNNITALMVDSQNKLWIGSSDGSICVLDVSSSAFKYILDIKNSTESDKGINSFVNYGNNMFVATGFGIVKISTITYNFVDAPYYQLGSFALKTKVFDLTVQNDIIYSATASGVAYANLINSNLNNPSSWTNYNTAPLNSNVKSIKAVNGKVFAGSDAGFDYFDGSNWINYPDTNYSGAPIKSIYPVGNRVYFIARNNVFSANIDSLSNVIPYNTIDNSNVLFSDNNQNPLVGVFEKGLFKSGIYVAPNCPNRNSFNFVNEDSFGNIWGASGLTDGGFYKFDGNNWTNYTIEQYPLLGSSNDCRKIFNRNNETWALFWGGGATILGDNIHNFNPSNSPLPGAGIPNNPNFCVPIGGAFDNNGYFWMVFYGTDNSKYLYAHISDTTFVGFTNPSYFSNTSHFNIVTVDNYSTKWIVTTGPSGLYYFNENGTINNPNDDVYGFYSTSEFPEVNTITNVIVDKNNSVWATTNNGVFILDNPLGAIQNPNSKPPFSKLGIISGNLKVPFTESCLTIFSDVLNEKWIGTDNNGVFHLSDDGSTLIEQFNITNSPILSNSINSIVVSSKTGRAYIGTLSGLSSIQTNAVQPLENFSKIICKPNPYVIPSVKNPTLTIDGLVESSTIKIITLNGEVIAEYTARQGKIDDQWNGTDKKGKLVPTGIYIIVAYNKDGSKVGTGKLAVIRK